MKKIMKVFAVGAFTTALIFTGCTKGEKASNKGSSKALGNGFSGSIELMHFSTSEESEGNGGSDGFRTMIAEWIMENPSVSLVRMFLVMMSTRLRLLLWHLRGIFQMYFFCRE